MAPIEEMSCLSNSGIQFAPPSVVFQTPPATAPKYHVFGSPGTPSIASARPPRNGPTCRHFIPLQSLGSSEPGGSGVAEGDGDALGDGESAAPPCGVGFVGGAANELRAQRNRTTEDKRAS